MPDNFTPYKRLASHLLGEDLGEWVEKQRHPLPDVTRSWRSVARQLEDATGGQVDPTPETLRKWHRAWVQHAFVDRLEAEVGEKAS